MVRTEIVEGKIEPFSSELRGESSGAELIFKGRVRDTESGKPIVALEYERYGGMAEKELQAAAAEAASKFPIHHLFCRHRVGAVPVGETALQISIWSEHREEGLKAMTWFISELKKRVPIWKWIVFPDGSKKAAHQRR